jgi:hypothetical protein
MADGSDLPPKASVGAGIQRRRSVKNEPTKIKVSAFRWVPPLAQGLVRDLRVRWALEEAGLAYEERPIGPEDRRSETYLALQPFGQVPSYEDRGAQP